MEIKERYEELVNRINSIGPIKAIVNNEQVVKNIIAYNGDRHLICAFFDAVNKAINAGILTDNDLKLFRSGKLMDLIVNLEDTLQEISGRSPFTSEKLDKVNYVSLIQDEKTLAVSYTHPAVLDAISGENDYTKNANELIWWVTCGTYNSLPKKVQSIINLSLLQRGKIEEVEKLLQSNIYGVSTYEEQNNNKYTIK